MTAAETYAAHIDAVNAQRARLFGGREQPGQRWGRDAAEGFKYDPHRSLDANLDTIASYIQAEDVFIDVGGGAGRVCLPMALRCREGVVVDGSAGMGEVFRELASAAGITNARFVHQEWLAADAIDGDVALAASVTYFVRDIVGFVEKMIATAHRRVMITVRSVTGPNQGDDIFRVIYGEEQEQTPGYQELFAGIVGDGHSPRCSGAAGGPPGTGHPLGMPVGRRPGKRRWRWLWEAAGYRPKTRTGLAASIEARFDELFAESAESFRPLWHRESKGASNNMADRSMMEGRAPGSNQKCP